MIKINLGSGPRCVPGWVNLDGALGARLHKLGAFRFLNGVFHFTNASWDRDVQLQDFRKPLPWPTGSVDAVYTSHTLEHLSREDGRRLLQECFRVLKPGAVLRILVPDLAAHVKGYAEGRVPAEDFLEDLGALFGAGKHGWKRVAARFVEFPHQCMYDTPSLLRICAALGFECEEKKAFESRIDDIRTIEIKDRTVAAVVVECRKPAA
ncbi:MAG: methyltransferase domain-containing protein [Betaproteobacteria bacterium]